MSTSNVTKAFEGVFVSILLIAIFATAFGILALGETGPSNEPITSFENLEVRPDGAVVDFGAIPSDPDALIEYAAYLFNYAGTTAKNADHLAAHCNCQMIMNAGSNNIVDIDATIIKTQTEYFRADYRIEVDCPLKRVFGNAFEIIISERNYTCTDMDYLAYQKVPNSIVTEDGRPTADWVPTKKNPLTEEQRAVPVYNSTQEGIFEVVPYNVTVDTIQSAEVTFVESEEGNYYRVDMVLDTSNPYLTERIIDTIRKGSSDPNAYYDVVTYSFEIWDNGFFKAITFQEIWKAKAMGMVNFVTDTTYNWTFSYDPDDANPDTYVNCKETKDAILGVTEEE
jgi:hypothetical protein